MKQCSRKVATAYRRGRPLPWCLRASSRPPHSLSSPHIPLHLLPCMQQLDQFSSVLCWQYSITPRVHRDPKLLQKLQTPQGRPPLYIHTHTQRPHLASDVLDLEDMSYQHLLISEPPTHLIWLHNLHGISSNTESDFLPHQKIEMIIWIHFLLLTETKQQVPTQPGNRNMATFHVPWCKSGFHC